MDEMEQANSELERIEAIITRHEGFMFTVRGWLLAIVGGLLVAYYQTRTGMSATEVRIGLLLIALLFLIVESRHVNLVEALASRALLVERDIAWHRSNEPALGWYDGPKVSETCQKGAKQLFPQSGMTLLLNLPFYGVVIIIIVIITVLLPEKSDSLPSAVASVALAAPTSGAPRAVTEPQGQTMILTAADGVKPDASLSETKTQGETQKLKYENQKLAEELSSPPWVRSAWTQLFAAFLGGLVAAGSAAAVALYTARRSRLGAFDQAVLEKRLEQFGHLVDATEAVALHFPAAPLTPATCKAIGFKLREGYFSGVGILLTADARDRYLLLMRALSLASVADRLNAPTLEDYPQFISADKVKKYREDLGLQDGGDLKEHQRRVDRWIFGTTLSDSGDDVAKTAHNRFRDFVLLQTLTSHLRTELTEALRGRIRPS